MATSPKLGLHLPTQVDPFSTDQIRQNWEKVDGSPGAYICTSATRPVWNANHVGRIIIETDTDLQWMWDGTKFDRLAAVGLLKKSNGDWAIGERTTAFESTKNTYNKVMAVTGVVIPQGTRPIRIDVAWQKASNPQGNFWGAIFQSNTDNSGPVHARWNFGTTGNDDNAGGGVFWAIVRNGLAAGTYDFSFQITAPSGTSKISAGVQTPITLMVTEL